MNEETPHDADVRADSCSWMECDEAPDMSVDDHRCLWHSEDVSKDTAPFEAALMLARTKGRVETPGWQIPVAASFGDRDSYVDWAEMDFSEATFWKAADFLHVRPLQARFYDTTFKQRAWFVKADFTRASVDFVGVTFEKGVTFAVAEFDEVVFDGCIFTEGATASFRNLKSRLARFRDCHFYGRTFFEQVGASDALVFSSCEFAGPTSFNDTDMTRVRFTRCSVDGLLLAGATFLSNADFHATAWPREGLAEEVTARARTPEHSKAGDSAGVENVDQLRRAVEGAYRGVRPHYGRDALQDAERVYRELRRSAETRRYWHDATYFYKREFEMRRLANGPARGRSLRRGVGSLEGWYAIVADYGTSLFRPFLWLSLLLFVVYPVVFAELGVKQDGTRLLLTFPPTFDEWSPLVALSISTASLVNQSATTVFSPTAQVAAVTLRLVGPILALLLSLAVRRRVRR